MYIESDIFVMHRAKIWELKVLFWLLQTSSQTLYLTVTRFHGVMVSTQDSESCDPSSNLGGTCVYLFSSDWNTVFCVYDKKHKWENCWKINDHLAVHYFQQIKICPIYEDITAYTDFTVTGIHVDQGYWHYEVIELSSHQAYTDNSQVNKQLFEIIGAEWNGGTC